MSSLELTNAFFFLTEMSFLSYVNEFCFAWKSAFLQDPCQLFYGGREITHPCQSYLKMHVVGEGVRGPVQLCGLLDI